MASCFLYDYASTVYSRQASMLLYGILQLQRDEQHMFYSSMQVTVKAQTTRPQTAWVGPKTKRRTPRRPRSAPVVMTRYTVAIGAAYFSHAFVDGRCSSLGASACGGAHPLILHLHGDHRLVHRPLSPSPRPRCR
jgi:hypothetical protein